MTLEKQLRALIKSSPPHVQRHFACACAERTLRRAKVRDKRSWKALKVAHRYAEGRADDAELQTAWSAAWSASYDATELATRYATASAACAAAPSAVGAAAESAAYAASGEEREWQLAHLQHLLAAHNAARSSLLSILQQRAESVQTALPRNKEALEEALFT